jgi:hypothetical protein
MVKWGGAVAALLILVTWLGSGLAPVSCFSATGRGIVVDKRALFVYMEATSVIPRPFVGWNLCGPNGGTRFWVDAGRTRLNQYARIPLWPAVLFSLLGAAIAWHRDRAATKSEQAGLCAKCRYDRAGLSASMPCPECGTPPTSAPHPTV